MKEIKIFDAHSDLLYDLARKTRAGVKNRFADYHVPELKNSVIGGAVWTMYSPDVFDLFADIKVALKEIKWDLLPGFQVILGLEGLRNMHHVEDIDRLYALGFRHAMVTWNEANQYASGVKADPDRGLTEEGKRLYKRMEELGMIIDLAHLNEKSFYEALETVHKNIIYSHGCVKKLCDHPRNVTDDQMRALKKVDGLLGLSPVGSFTDKDPKKRNLSRFLDHVDAAIEIMGIDNVCFGFDFMDYLSEFPNSNISDVPDATQAYKIIDGLLKRGMSEEDIHKICYDNFFSRYGGMVYRCKEE